MPKGAKKRKAAKKKKEKEANINLQSDNPQGNDDLKSQDEKGSDGGEGSSPANHDQDDHHLPYNEESEEVEEGDLSVAHPSVPDIQSMKEVPSDITNVEVVGGQEASVVKIESDLKSEESLDRVNDSVERVKSFKESPYEKGNTSGTLGVESLNESNSKDEFYDSNQKTVTSEGLTYPVGSSAEVIGGHKVLVKIDSGLKSEKSSERINDIVAHVNSSAELVGEQEVSAVKIVSALEYEESSDIINVEHVESAKESHYGNGNSSGTSNIESLNENKSKAIVSEDLAYPVDSSLTKMSMTAENATGKETSNLIVENDAVRETSNLVVEPCVNSVKEVASLCEVNSSYNGNSSLEDSAVSQAVTVDLAMKRYEDKVYPLPDQHVSKPDLLESTPTEYGNEVSASVSEIPTPVTESTKDADDTKGSETPEFSENQPQLVSAPRMVQKSSWLSCCGLFEVLSGSNR